MTLFTVNMSEQEAHHAQHPLSYQQRLEILNGMRKNDDYYQCHVFLFRLRAELSKYYNRHPHYERLISLFDDYFGENDKDAKKVLRPGLGVFIVLTYTEPRKLLENVRYLEKLAAQEKLDFGDQLATISEE